MNVIIVTGPPYSGKGTQCAFISETTGFKHVSTGDLCRQEKASGSDVGRKIAQYDEKGDLVPDDIIYGLFAQAIDANIELPGIILDGYPRTLPQAKDLIGLLEEKNVEVSMVVNIEVEREELFNRAKTRALTSTRKDDKDPKVHEKRIEVFEEVSVPAIQCLADNYTTQNVLSDGTIDEMKAKVLALFQN